MKDKPARRRPRAHPRPIASDLAPILDFDTDQPDEYGLLDGRQVQMDLTNRMLTPLEMRRFNKTGKLPKDVQLMPHKWPPIYGRPDPEYEGGWGLRHPDGKTGHAHGDGISLWVHEGECRLCDTQQFEEIARIVRDCEEGLYFLPYCLDALPRDDDARIPCGWCDDKARYCKCECHRDGTKEWDEDLQRHTRLCDYEDA